MSVNNWNSILSNTRNLNDVLIILRKVLAQLSNKIDITQLDEVISNLEHTNKLVLDDLEVLKSALDSINEQGGWYKPYLTEVLLLEDKPDVSFLVGKALDTKKTFAWTRTSNDGDPVVGYWEDTGLSELDQAKAFTVDLVSTLALKITLKKTDSESILPVLTDANNNILIGYDTTKDQIEAVGLQEQVLDHFASLQKTNDSNNIPILTDANNKILIGYNKYKDQIEAVGLQEQVLDHFSNVRKSEDTQNIALLTDANNNILIGYDTVDDRPIIAGLDLSLTQKRTIAEYNGMHGFGQSLGVGATAVTILSNVQPYFNVTYNTGPRMDSAATSMIPLIEQHNNPSSDGYANRGETFCSGAANYASRSMMLGNGIDPKDHRIFASAAGHGGYRIDQLKKGTAWYNFFLKHITEAKRLIGDKSYQVQVTPWVQGENDAIAGQQTPKSIYKPELLQLQKDISADVKAITGQTDDVLFITYQMSYAARTWSDQALAQLELVQEEDNFGLSTPMYHMLYATDNIHLTSIGYKWMGAYIGRAYTQFVVENRKPDFINPISAQIDQNKVIIKFIVPKKPLVLDTTTLANTTNYGFKVVDDSSNEIEITSVEAFDDEVQLTLATAPTSDLKVRYALDYLGFGLTVTNGASGNLRDSTTDTVIIANEEKPLYHVCPHFALTAFLDKGI